MAKQKPKKQKRYRSPITGRFIKSEIVAAVKEIIEEDFSHKREKEFEEIKKIAKENKKEIKLAKKENRKPKIKKYKPQRIDFKDAYKILHNSLDEKQVFKSEIVTKHKPQYDKKKDKLKFEKNLAKLNQKADKFIMNYESENDATIQELSRSFIFEDTLFFEAKKVGKRKVKNDVGLIKGELIGLFLICYISDDSGNHLEKFKILLNE